jgi:PAS domain S-box-containing protein
MKFLTAKSRITFGIVCLIASIIAIASAMNLGPDQRRATMLGRSRLCEAIAIDCAIHLNRSDMTSVRCLLDTLVARNDQLLSAGLRRDHDRLDVEAGNHVTFWNEESLQTTETHLSVPLEVGSGTWGHLELVFIPLAESGLVGFMHRPWTRFVLVVCAISFCCIYFYLGFVLQQLDPSQSVPKRVRTALDSLTEGLLLTDRKGRVVLANEAFATWAGRTPEKLIGQLATRFPWVQIGDREENDRIPHALRFPWLRAIVDQAPQTRWLMKLRDHDKNELTVIANSSPIIGHDGEYRGVMTSFEDVSELERHKVELSHAKSAADRANKAKSMFLANMSHEIRTPMNAILGYTEVLRNGYFDSEVNRQKYLATIHNSGEHLLALINDILDLSKIEAGNMEIECERCSTRELLAQTVNTLQIKAQQKRITLRYETDRTVPDTIRTDAFRLKQALLNLIGNAIKFTDRGGVTVIVRSVREGSKQLLAFDVIDTGVGIPPDQQKKIFDPFSQADSSITRKFGGTGLGLSISRQIAEKLGGGICVESVPGQGSKFTVTIDPGVVDNVSMVRFSSEDDIQAVEIKPQESRYRFEGKHFLVVDDGESNRELASLLLKRAGGIITAAENGREALDLASRNRYDVILMDMQMPVLDGFSATRELRRRSYDGPIIALTANVMQEDEQMCREAGCDAFLAKPISSALLLKTVALFVAHEIFGTETESADTESGSLLSQESVLPDRAEVQAESEILPSLPMDDPDYRMIAEMFVGRLRTRVPEMKTAASINDLPVLADLAHWLKGAGGTAGFDVFTGPAMTLQRAARNGQLEDIQAALTEIQSICERIRFDLKTAESATLSPLSL